MLPPRYLLREAALLRLCGEHAGRFLEIGCGGGELLITLARRGFSGVATDLSASARSRSRRRLAEEGITTVTIVDEEPPGATFDYVFLLEVIGYAADPVELLGRCREFLVPGGSLVLSFVPPGAGYSTRVTHDMRCFEPDEIDEIVRGAGLTPVETVNYGFPLANALVPVMNGVHGLRLRLAGNDHTGSAETGLGHTSPVLAPLGLLSNRTTIAPFVQLQRLFSRGRRGNGYLVRALRQ